MSTFCEVCDKELQSVVSLEGHKLGRKHRNQLAAREGVCIPKRAYPPISEEELFSRLACGRFRNVVVLTGAGISTSAGIPDFRSEGGLFPQIDAAFGDRFPEVRAHPANLLSRSFVLAHPTEWREEVVPWLKRSQQKNCDTATPTAAHKFCSWLHERGWLRRVYTQNVDGLHLHPELNLPPDRVVECHGAFGDGSTVLYGDDLPERFFECATIDFVESREVDLLLVMGTSLQVAPFCALPNLAPPGSVRVLVNRSLADCLVNNWSPQSTRTSTYAATDLAGPTGMALNSSTRLGGQSVSLRPFWTARKGDRRWQQLLVEGDADDFVCRFRDVLSGTQAAAGKKLYCLHEDCLESLQEFPNGDALLAHMRALHPDAELGEQLQSFS